MGFLSHFEDVLSEKIYKQNILITPIIERLAEKVEPRDDFVMWWVYCCMTSINGLLNTLLFENLKDEKGNEVNFNAVFKKNIEKLDEQKIFEIFKLIAGHFLTVFLKNKDSEILLKAINSEKKEFEQEIVTIFEFSRKDEEYREKLAESHSYKDSSALARYFHLLYNEIFLKGFGITLPRYFVGSKLSECDPVALYLFQGSLSNSFVTFMELLQDKVK